MKRCEYCGNQYSDHVTICPADGHSTINPAERLLSGLDASDVHPAFEAKVVSPLSAAGAYLVFIRGSDVIFITTESGAGFAFRLVGHLLGPLAGLITVLEWLSSRGKNTQHENLRSANSPENLLRENSKNFKLNQAEIREASIEPIKYVARSGKAGRLVFTIRHGEKIKLEFDSTDEMNRAICLLTETLQPALTINGTAETKTAKVKTV